MMPILIGVSRSSLATGGGAPGAMSWSLYEVARNPYVILIVIYVFYPYFATAVVGDPVKGHTLVANISMICGLCVAFTAPLLGASIDKIGWRKPLLLLMTALMLPLLVGLWWIKPWPGGLSLGLSSVALGFLGLVFTYSELQHNSMLPRAAIPRQVPFASGLGQSLGNFFSVFMLVFVLWASSPPVMVRQGLNHSRPAPRAEVTIKKARWFLSLLTGGKPGQAGWALANRSMEEIAPPMLLAS